MAFPQPQQSDTSVEETLASFESIPLFMKSLPEDAFNDTAISALQSLVHEGTPDEIAQNFKDQGNDYFKGKRYREALGFYTQGIDAQPTDASIREALLCNRAACNLELQNYGSVLRDCSEALKANTQCSKAYYRSAMALVALERYDEALDCCDRCLAYDQDNAGVGTLRSKATDLKEKKDRKEREQAEKLRREKEEAVRLAAAFKERNLIVQNSPKGTADNHYSPKFDPEDPTGRTLCVPAFFLYPQYATSDIIAEFQEDTPFSAHIAAMFPPQAPPPEWDQRKEYTDGRLVVYAMTHRKRLLKVGKKMTLRDVFKASAAKAGEPQDGLEIKDGCLTFAVLPRGDEEQKWIEEYKRRRDH